MMIDVEQLLENTIPEPNTGCLLWLGSCMKSGYGEVTRGGRNGLYVHRLVWEHFHGPIPPGRFVCHRCDVRSCINDNPADTGHLFLGTPADNIHDAMSKNRLDVVSMQRHGEAHHNSRLTDDLVRSIRRRAAAGESNADIAADLKMTSTNIWYVVKRLAWKHVE